VTSWSAGEYLPYDICIRLFGCPNVLFCSFADFYEITNIKFFDIQSCQPDRLYFMIIYIYVNKFIYFFYQNNENTLIEFLFNNIFYTNNTPKDVNIDILAKSILSSILIKYYFIVVIKSI
jgi:hypothetical protein